MPIHDWTRVPTGIFHDFHQEWSRAIKAALNAGLLPPDYYALIEQVTSKPKSGRVGPDVLTLQSVPPDGGDAGAGPSAVLSLPPEARTVVTGDRDFYRRKKNVVRVRHVSGDRVVAVVELMSPGNKAGKRAFAESVGKACDLLERRVHLLLVDLFPPTARDPNGVHGAIWEELYGDPHPRSVDRPLTAVAYECNEDEVRGYVEPLAAGGALPDMPVFLRPGGCVMLPLETTYAAAWESVPPRWRRVVDPPPAG